MQPCIDAYKAAKGAKALGSVVLNMSLYQQMLVSLNCVAAAGVSNVAKHCLNMSLSQSFE